MRTPLLATVLSLSFGSSLLAQAATPVWKEGFAMGTVEYFVDDGKGNSLVIDCPMDEERHIFGYAHVQGKDYSSGNELSDGNQTFSLIIDGETFSNPFETDCRVCGDIFRHSFWPALRKAKKLQLRVDGHLINLPVRNLSQLLKPLDHPDNQCRSAW